MGNMRLLKKWYNYIFKRNPFVNPKEEKAYVLLLLIKRYLKYGKDIPYENYLLKIKIYPNKVIWVGMKSRGTGYIFTRGQ